MKDRKRSAKQQLQTAINEFRAKTLEKARGEERSTEAKTATEKLSSQ
jgi:hypothetical protein